MERLGVNLLQDRKDVKKTCLEELMNNINSLNKKSIVYQNPAYAYIKDYFLDFKDNKMYVLDKALQVIDQIDYSEIQYVSVTICSRWPGVRYNRYQIDLDIFLNKNVMKFEIFNPRSFLEIVEVMESNHIEIIDIAGIISLYKRFPNYDMLGEYLGKHFNEIARKYKLEHPRTN